MRTKYSTWTNEELKELYYTTGDVGYEKASEIYNLKKKSIQAVFWRRDLPHINWARYRKIRKLTETEKAYIAGIIDGEGHVSVKNRKIAISNTDKNLMDWLKDKLGGSICKAKVYKSNHTQSYQYSLSKMGAVILIRSILSHLIIKNKVACEFLRTHDKET